MEIKYFQLESYKTNKYQGDDKIYKFEIPKYMYVCTQILTDYRIKHYHERTK